MKNNISINKDALTRLVNDNHDLLVFLEDIAEVINSKNPLDDIKKKMFLITASHVRYINRNTK